MRFSKMLTALVYSRALLRAPQAKLQKGSLEPLLKSCSARWFWSTKLLLILRYRHQHVRAGALDLSVASTRAVASAGGRRRRSSPRPLKTAY